MSTIGERVHQVRMQADNGGKMTLVNFASLISISNQAVSAIETGRTNPSKATVDLICREFNIDRHWLETGEGEMKKPPLDEVAEILSEVMDEGEDDPFYQWMLSLLKAYQKLDDRSRAVIQRLIDELKAQQ